MAGSSVYKDDGDGEGITDINVTPFVDVVLVLLVVFMVTAKLIVNRGVNALDNRTVEKIIKGILAIAGAKAGGFGVLWITSTDSHASYFERVLRFERGTLIPDESPAPGMAAQ